ncbi:histidine kinase-like ATPase [Glomus cerebriforme]|uniref:DNA topoisomerase 2 n=1 Tax=Glomus cerebriforme TaxID=658196 RepID=A0A397S0Q0_9GLOM|nr:histidine kinase-like ATPase [Glomus cerebriforme]
MAEKKKKDYSSVQDYQVIDNSIDEAVVGHCDQIKVILSPDQRTITVEDNGYGVPIEIHPKTNQSVLVTLFSALKSGGKFDDKIYKTSGQTEILEFSRGILKSEQIIDSPQATDGLTVTFAPDPEIFHEFAYSTFKPSIIQSRLQELAYLNPNLTLIFKTSPQAEPITYHFSSGLAGWEYFHGSFAWQYNSDSKKGQIKSFCNNINTAGGGTHVEGFENGLVSACRD